MEYKTVFWSAIDEEEETLEDIMRENKGWKIFNMFLVYKAENEAYRVVLYRT